jgi:hypothetical protein
VASVRIWLTEAESGAICTAFEAPSRIGPITVAPSSAWMKRVEIIAE